MEKQIFKYGSYSYEYYLVRQVRKTISLIVQPSLKVILKCPIDCDSQKIEKFLKNKWKWLEKQLTFFKKFNGRANKKEYISGESFLYLGRQYKLLVRKGKAESVKLKFGKILINTTKEVSDKNNNKKLLNDWYTVRSLKIFDDQYKKVLEKFSYDFEPSLVIRKMNKRWGSFVRGRSIILNSLLIHTSKDCIDYVITHELCHVRYRNHTKAFFKLLKTKCSDWEKIKDKLEMRLIQ